MSKMSDWVKAKAELDYWKLAEKRLRVEILEEAFPNAVNCTKKGYIDGVDISAGFGLIYKVDTLCFDLFYDDMSKEQKDCFSFPPKFSVSKYKKLDDTKLIDEVLETKPSLPTLKVEG